MALRDMPNDDDRPEVIALFANLKAALPLLQALLDKYNGDWEYEDRVYRSITRASRSTTCRSARRASLRRSRPSRPAANSMSGTARSCPRGPARSSSTITTTAG